MASGILSPSWLMLSMAMCCGYSGGSIQSASSLASVATYMMGSRYVASPVISTKHHNHGQAETGEAAQHARSAQQSVHAGVDGSGHVGVTDVAHHATVAAADDDARYEQAARHIGAVHPGYEEDVEEHVHEQREHVVLVAESDVAVEQVACDDVG